MKFYPYHLLFILFINISYCQKNNVYIEYNIKIADDGSFTKDKMFADTFLNAVKEANKLMFGLLISDNNSKFYEVDTGIAKGYETEMAKIYAKYTGMIYIVNEEIYKQSELLGNNIYTKEKNVENWMLTNESKLIDSYLCFKATNTYTVVNPKGVFKFPVTAWYCPKIPYSHGPLGYGNLPGLILELQVRNVTYASKKINLESDLTLDTEFLKKSIILTNEELEKKLKEFNNFEDK